MRRYRSQCWCSFCATPNVNGRPDGAYSVAWNCQFIVPHDPTAPEADLDTVGFYAFNTGTGRLGLEGNGVKQDRLKTVAENPVLLQFKAESRAHLEAMNQHLEAHGVTLYDRSVETSYGILTNFCDPDGNKLEILYEG